MYNDLENLVDDNSEKTECNVFEARKEMIQNKYIFILYFIRNPILILSTSILYKPLFIPVYKNISHFKGNSLNNRSIAEILDTTPSRSPRRKFRQSRVG